jgi:FtsP/CotA-like multicopper oxidase with cupredoxin domain
MPIRELVRHGKAWALNGVVDRPEKPLLTARRGSCQEIVIENRTAWPHAMHLHGHHFEVPASGWSAPVLRDTVLLDPGDTLALRFRADNPGRWLLHCHMLEHQAGGMVTWIEVT